MKIQESQFALEGREYIELKNLILTNTLDMFVIALVQFYLSKR